MPDSVDSSLIFLSERQEALLTLLKGLEAPERMMAIVRLADGYSVSDASRMSLLREGKVESLTRKTVKRLTKTLAGMAVVIPPQEPGAA